MAGPERFPVFEAVVSRRGRTWKWFVCTTEGAPVMCGSESSQSAAKYRANQAILSAAPYWLRQDHSQRLNFRPLPPPWLSTADSVCGYDTGRTAVAPELQNAHSPIRTSVARSKSVSCIKGGLVSCGWVKLTSAVKNAFAPTRNPGRRP
jgi:hypothetical protein